jgi:hypothetical protein
MKRIAALLIITSCSLIVSAQLKTFLTLEAGPQWSLIKVVDPGNYFESANLLSSIGGITLEQEVMENLFVVSGLYYLPYKTGINMTDKRRIQSRSEAYNSLMIPLRIQYRIEPTEYPVSFTPRLGYIFSINSGPETNFINSSIISAPDGTAFSYNQEQSSVVPSGHLLEVGLGIGLRIAGLWQASVNLSYFSGVLSKPASSFMLDYSDQQGNDYQAEYTTRGNGLYTTLSFHMPVSNIWQKRDYRIQARIENSSFKGKSVERKGEFYAGGELGALWRLFHTSNPAVGARPMEGRGLFRYANLHTGVYGGYMLTHELGLDLGVLYQRSSTFYAIMYDHEVDFTDKTAAPMYLEVPLRIRYFYDVYKSDLFVVVYGGASLLTQFSSGGAAGPAGDFNYTAPVDQATVNGSASSTATRLSNIRPLLRLGAGAEYRLPIAFPMFATAYVNYMQGFMDTEEVSVTTSVNEIPAGTSITYNGSAWSFDIGIKIPMSFDDRENCVRLTKKK